MSDNEPTTTIRIYQSDKPRFDEVMRLMTLARDGRRVTQPDALQKLIDEYLKRMEREG